MSSQITHAQSPTSPLSQFMRYLCAMPFEVEPFLPFLLTSSLQWSFSPQVVVDAL